MAGGTVGSRVVLPTLATAAVTCGIAIVVNLATEWKTNLWAWLTVGVLTLVSAATSLWLLRRQNASADDTAPSDEDSINVTMGRRWRARHVLLESKGSNSLRAGSRAQMQDLTMRAGFTDRPPDTPDSVLPENVDPHPKARE